MPSANLPDLTAALEFAQNWARTSGDDAKEHWGSASIAETHHGGADISTDVDKKLELKFYNSVQESYPEFGFKGEEFPELNRSGDYTWLIDPIDGSKYYALGIPLWCTTMALVDSTGKPVVGVVYNPVSSQMYTAIVGQGAFLNGTRLAISDSKFAGLSLAKRQLVWDTVINFEIDSAETIEHLTEINKRFQKNVYRLRFLGSGPLSLCWLAQGFFAAFVDIYRDPAKYVDIAAGVLIAEEAGAVVERRELGEREFFVVAEPRYLPEITRLVESDG